MKIAIVVHGRFHAFDLARGLLRHGHDVTLFTNYPAYVVERYGVEREHVRTYLTHGILSRAARKTNQKLGFPYVEKAIHRTFGRWAAREVAKESWDIVQCFSGVAEELFNVFANRTESTILTRGSSHIRTQARLLEEESRRADRQVKSPSPWMIEREEREYELADHIGVLSTFAKRTFVEEDLPSSKVDRYTLGVDTSTFRPSEDVIERRCQRIRSGKPIQVLFVGTLSYRKGMLDAIEIARALREEPFGFRFVGPVAHSFRRDLKTLKGVAEHVPSQPHHELPKWYEDGDVFLFPTIEDGFAVVLTQAQAGGLPLIATTNCSAPDLVEKGKNGWVLPIRSPNAFIERLQWCNHHRDELAGMVHHMYNNFRGKSWEDTAAEFEDICQASLGSSSN